MVRRRGELSGAPVNARSAGFTSEGDAPPQATLDVASRRGLDLTNHRSKLVDVDTLAAADLVIAMTSAHVREALAVDPDVGRRAFVFGELVRLNKSVGRRRVSETLDAWLGRLNAARAASSDHAVSSDEVRDPFGRRKRVHERVASHLERLVLELADCSFEPLGPTSDSQWRG